MKDLNSDGVSKKDLLGRQHFAKDIAHKLVHSVENGDESIVFGLNGKWGSGKSTLLKFIVDEINIQYSDFLNSEDFFILEFNPWLFSGQEELQRKFLSKLAKGLGDKNQAFKNITQKFSKALDKFSLVKYLHPALAEGIKDVQESLEKYNDETPIEELKEEIDKLIVNKNFRIYITIDDLDRLKPNEITDVFQMVKLNANFKNTVFLISYDREVVTDSLDSMYHKKGEQYLEKIVQIDFTVPEILSEKIEDIFFLELSEFVRKNQVEFNPTLLIEVWQDTGLRKYFRTLRDVYRFINSLNFRLPAIEEEINITDFILLEAVRIFDFPAYDLLYKKFSSELTQGIQMFSSPNEDDKKVFKNSPTFEIIKYFFEKRPLDVIYTFSTSKELCDPKYFERYFSLKIPDKDIAERELRDFIYNASNRKNLLDSVLRFGRMDNLLRRLSNPQLHRHYRFNNEPIFKELLNFWNYEFNISTFEIYKDQVWCSIKNMAIGYDDPHHGYVDVIEDLITYYNPLSFSRLYYLIYIQELSRHNQLTQEFGEYIGIVKSYEYKINEALKKQLNSWGNMFMGGSYDKISIYFSKSFFKSFSFEHPEEYSRRVDKLLDDEKYILHILKFFVYLNERQKPSRLDFKEKEIFLPEPLYHKFLSNIENIKLQTISFNDRRNVDFFLKTLEI